MRAVRIHNHGSYDVLQHQEIPRPEPEAGQVLIKVAWSALNHLDSWVRRGVPGHVFPLPMTPGCDFSGVVEVVGEGVEGWQEGDRVAVSPGFSCGSCPRCERGEENLCRRYGIYGETIDGGQAEFAVVQSENLIAVPDGFPLDLAAAFPLTYLTAWHMVMTRCDLLEGERVLVHAAGSGVSVAATQIARLGGAEVFVTAGSDEKVAKGIEQGASAGANYTTSDWVADSKEWLRKGGFDVIVDHVGRDTLPKGVWLLNKGGRIVTCGVTSGPQMDLNFAPIFFKTLSVLGSTMGRLQELHTVADHVWNGRLQPVVDSRFSFEDVAAAHEKMANRDVFGKILVQIDSSLT